MIIFALYMKKKIAVIGDGGWGTAVALLLAEKGYGVTLWGAFPDYTALLNQKRVNEKFLPGVKIPASVRLTSDIGEIADSSLFVIAVPTKYLRKVLSGFRGKTGKIKAISLTKGIEADTLKRPAEIISEILDIDRLAVLSGPSISFEVARKFPTTVVASADDAGFRQEVQETFNNASYNFRVYTSGDTVGVELGGALKNIIAIAAGISDGMGFGANSKAAILTRGLVEITRLGVKMGAGKETFFGLSGLGDLATTCMSSHSRNRWLGEEIGKGRKLKEVLKETEMIIEGVNTAKSARDLAGKMKTEMPITEKIYQVLHEDKEPKEALRELMARALKAEAVG